MLKNLIGASTAIAKASKTKTFKDIAEAAHKSVKVVKKLGGSTTKKKCSEKREREGKCNKR